MEREISAIILGGGLVSGIGVLAIYLYIAFCLMKIAQKVGLQNGWWGFIPILNLFLMVQIAGKDWWWALLIFVPLVNIVIMVILWMAIAERRHKPNWYGILMIVPIANLIIPGLLAFTE